MNHFGKKDSVNTFQLQPAYASRDKWEALAMRENLAYEALELSMPPALDDSKLQELYRKWYLKSGRVTSVHGSFIGVDPGSGDRRIRELSRERCVQSCRLATDLGAGNVIFHSSCFPFLRGAYLESWAEGCAEFYEELAASFDLNIFIENSQDIDAVPLRELMKRISTKRVGVCLDLGHVNYSLMPVEHWFEELHEWIGYLHLSDNPGRIDEHMVLGKGTVDWEKADRLWRELGRAMPVTLETGNPDDTAGSIAYLREHRFFAIDEIN
jgi:sugar phosphate isomerase/epimerase